jgi:Fic family protein
MPPEEIQTALQPHLDRLRAKAASLRERQPLPAAFVESLEHKLIIELTHGSTAIEGNTLTLRETQLLIDEGITPGGAKKLREIHETLNHHQAVLQVRRWVAEKHPVDEAALCALHRIVMTRIDDERSGSWRSDRVFVTGAPLQLIRPERIPDAMQDLLSWISSASHLHPFVLAAEAHYRFVKIHPFYDGNGRNGRLLFNWLLLRQGYPLAVIPAEARSRYIHSIDQADLGQPLAFFELLCECVESSLDQFLAA